MAARTTAAAAATTTTMMRAAVIHEVGGPHALQVQQWPIPQPQPGQVLIRIKAFGLNRSEMLTRQGHSPTVSFPRILGIEAVGLVASSPSGEFPPNTIVATAMGGMGRAFDGGYAEFTCVPASQVQAIHTPLPWSLLGALPEMMHTAWGSLFKSLRLQKSDHLLIRGGTSSVGLAAAAIAKGECAGIAVTTRKGEREAMLRENGADEVYVDGGEIAGEVRRRRPEGYDKVLELVGVTSLADSLQCVAEGGIVCVTGVTGGKWIYEDFDPIGTIPKSVYLTAFSSATGFMDVPLEEIGLKLASRASPFPIKTFTLDQIVEAHEAMENNTAGAKIVVLL